jgi:hypothetical protein
MRRNGFVLCAAFVAGCGAVLLAAVAAPSGSRPWEYAVYLEYPGNYEWQAPGQRVRGTNVDTFFRRMDMPTGIEVDARSNDLRTKIFNHVGQQGWELAQVVKDGGQEAYWFKRPR